MRPVPGPIRPITPVTVWSGQFATHSMPLTILSRPHPSGIRTGAGIAGWRAAATVRSPSDIPGADAGPNILADNANWLRTRLTKNGVPPAAIEAHLSVIGNPAAMEAALAWYRARGVRHQPVGPTRVPTLFIWGDQDDTVGRAAAEGTGEFIAAPYQFAALAGVGHYAADQVPEQVNALLLAHLARHPLDHCWLENRRPTERWAGIMRDRMAATASVLNRSSMSSRAARQRGEGEPRTALPPTALTDGATNDGGMTDYLLLFFKAPAGR